MNEDLLHDMHAVCFAVQAADGLYQDTGQVWPNQRLRKALQPQLQRSSQLNNNQQMLQSQPATI